MVTILHGRFFFCCCVNVVWIHIFIIIFFIPWITLQAVSNAISEVNQETFQRKKKSAFGVIKWLCTGKFFFFFFYWWTIGLQCCVGHCHTLTSISHWYIYTHTHTHTHTHIYIYIYVPPPVCGKFNIEHNRIFCAFSFCAILEGQNASTAYPRQGRWQMSSQ